MNDLPWIMAFIGALTLLNAYWARKNQQEYNQLALCHQELEALKVRFDAHTTAAETKASALKIELEAYKSAAEAISEALRERIRVLEEHNMALYAQIAELASRRQE